MAADADATSGRTAGAGSRTDPLIRRADAPARPPGLSSAHHRADRVLARRSHDAANHATTRCASRLYWACGWLPFGAGSAWTDPVAVSFAQSGGSNLPLWV